MAVDLTAWLNRTARELGFAAVSVSQPDLSKAQNFYHDWIQAGFHGEMGYMARNADKRFAPAQLVPETVSIISVAMPYLPAPLTINWQNTAWQNLETSNQAYVSRYAHGRDYHKVVRSRLQTLAERLTEYLAPEPVSFRVFSDSAPVPEVEIATQSGLGWRGKHTLLISRTLGSMFFLGELYVSVDLPVSAPEVNHCGSCSACMDVCPTRAIVAPYQVDARRCISYLTIEYSGVIPHEFRAAIGNRIYGCDDCQLVCPWNKFAQATELPDFIVRNGLDDVSLLTLLAWDETTFNQQMAGSAIYRIGHAQWQRNILLALGNLGNLSKSQMSTAVLDALSNFLNHLNPILAEQAQWSRAQLLS
ncbi:MAG: queG [Burkholderiaceae bacterium]|nr:queG [Burkholderiaceae bacterium]